MRPCIVAASTWSPDFSDGCSVSVPRAAIARQVRAGSGDYATGATLSAVSYRVSNSLTVGPGLGTTFNFRH